MDIIAFFVIFSCAADGTRKYSDPCGLRGKSLCFARILMRAKHKQKTLSVCSARRFLPGEPLLRDVKSSFLPNLRTATGVVFLCFYRRGNLFVVYYLTAGIVVLYFEELFICGASQLFEDF